jgi:hypothetical protein
MKSVVIEPSTIRDRAYTRWQKQGCPEGTAEQDWIEAERELSEQTASEGVAPAAVPEQPPSIAPAAPPSAPTSKRAKPPRPTLKRSPGARAAKLLNEVSPRATASRTQIALAAAAAAHIKRSAVGSG